MSIKDYIKTVCPVYIWKKVSHQKAAGPTATTVYLKPPGLSLPWLLLLICHHPLDSFSRMVHSFHYLACPLLLNEPFTYSITFSTCMDCHNTLFPIKGSSSLPSADEYCVSCFKLNWLFFWLPSPVQWAGGTSNPGFGQLPSSLCVLLSRWLSEPAVLGGILVHEQ